MIICRTLLLDKERILIIYGVQTNKGGACL